MVLFLKVTALPEQPKTCLCIIFPSGSQAQWSTPDCWNTPQTTPLPQQPACYGLYSQTHNIPYITSCGHSGRTVNILSYWGETLSLYSISFITLGSPEDPACSDHSLAEVTIPVTADHCLAYGQPSPPTAYLLHARALPSLWSVQPTHGSLTTLSFVNTSTGTYTPAAGWF